MHVPAENLTLIVRCALQELDASPGALRHRGICVLSGFSLASQKFRQIALREIFRTYHVTESSHFQGMDDFPDLYKWVRVLHCPVNIAMQATKEQYARFTFLRCVHLWGATFGLSSVLQRLPLSVQEMTLPFDHANDHTSVLTSTSRLKNLTCLRIARSRFEVPPASDEPCADVPPHHYTYSCIAADLLKPLHNLRSLQVDHYLTDTDVFDFHASQCPWSSASSAFCPTCWDRFGEQTVNAEIKCTEILARGMRSLEIVTWKSWFTTNAEGYSRLFITYQPGREGREELRVEREREAVEADWKKLMLGVARKCHKRLT